MPLRHARCFVAEYVTHRVQVRSRLYQPACRRVAQGVKAGVRNPDACKYTLGVASLLCSVPRHMSGPRSSICADEREKENTGLWMG